MAFTTCFLFLTRSADMRIVPYVHDSRKAHSIGLFAGAEKPLAATNLDSVDAAIPHVELSASDIKHWSDPDDNEDPDRVEPGTEQDGTPRGANEISLLQDEKDKRKLWRYLYRATAK